VSAARPTASDRQRCVTARAALRYIAGMTVGPSNKSADESLVVETEPSAEDVRFLEDGLIDFNLQTTGITDGSFIGIFLREDDGARAGGLYGWVWGSTCYVRYLFVAGSLRGQGQGTRLMRAVEAEARARNCRQIVLETHSFQAPGFYRKLGFEVIGRVDGYPRGHEYLTLVKRLD
jgi:ribosomal protein S18 acetylase RimI-like enzyme